MKEILTAIIMLLILIVPIAIIVVCKKKKDELWIEVLATLNCSEWKQPFYDDKIIVKSRQTLDNYDTIKYLKECPGGLAQIKNKYLYKAEKERALRAFLIDNPFVGRTFYGSITKSLQTAMNNAGAYRVSVDYISSAGNHLGHRDLWFDKTVIDRFENNPVLLMGKGEFNRFLKEQEKEALEEKRHAFYEKVNNVVDYTTENKEQVVLKGKKEVLDNLIAQLFDRTVNSIQKIKTINSEEWSVIDKYVSGIRDDIEKIVSENKMILDYYESAPFKKIKETCDTLMSAQREFNEYIIEKVETISTLFGTRVSRNETVSEDENNYIRPYNKTITPFTAEVSSTVFSSAENRPLEYIVKNFYPNKAMYPEQIQKLHLLVEELETLKEAKKIIDNYKADYQHYLSDVPSYIMEKDADGFYKRLGFAVIDEDALTVEYKFSYTSGGGYAQRSFTVPMTEENIVELIKMLESKLTASAFSKEQRLLMTKKLREHIKERDNYTCCQCGNSTHIEPNLLLEIDHILPVAKGGITEESNLQTLCWKCNRTKSDKIL